MKALEGFQLILFTIAVSLGIFMNVLDASIANVAIPTIAGNMAVSADQGTWVITSFTVSTAIVLPLTGWLAKRFGEVRLFVVSTALFTVTSVLCGLSTSLPMLVFFRVIQGAFAGPMIPLSQSLLLANFPDDKKGLATALWSTVAVAAPVLGPIMGGYITDNYTWPWIFYINLPVGLFSIYFTWSILSKRETATEKKPIDFVGLILLAVGIGSLQVLLDNGQDLDWFNSNLIIILGVTSLICLSFLIAWELTDEHPILDLSLFRGRNFTVGAISLSLGYTLFFGSVVILPLWLQTQMNYTPTWAGLATAPIGIIPVLLSPIVGRYLYNFDLRVLVSFGFIVFAVCSFWIAASDTSITVNNIATIRFLQGFGIPFFFIPLISIILSGLPNKDLANAAGLSNFLRILGGSFGTSISVALWNRREALHQSQLVESLPYYGEGVQTTVQILQGQGLSEPSSFAAVTVRLVNQAYMLATNDIFWLSGFTFLGLMAFTWFARPPFFGSGAKVAME
jgi:DHA2 family multidrug resistance protein